MKTYRFTLDNLYKHDCLGRDDVSVRQGHYVEARSEVDAWRQIRERFPNDTPVRDLRSGKAWEGG